MFGIYLSTFMTVFKFFILMLSCVIFLDFWFAYSSFFSFVLNSIEFFLA